MENNPLAFTFRIPSVLDVDYLTCAFRAERPVFFGLRTERAWCVMTDMICSRDRDLEILIADVDGRIAGFLVIMLNSETFWRRFCIRVGPWPLFLKAAEAVYRKMFRPFGRSQAQEEFLDNKFSEFAKVWHVSLPCIAKVVYAYVDPNFRRCSIGSRLYRESFARLQKDGFYRLDCEIRLDNQISVAYHRALGFDVGNTGVCYYGIKQLP